MRAARAVARAREDRGAATIWVLAVTSLLALVGAGAVLVAAAVVARHRAESAADLAALAAAQRAAVSDPTACAHARRVAGAGGGELQSCEIGSGGVVEVRVTVAVLMGPAGERLAQARARAGPVPDEQP